MKKPKVSIIILNWNGSKHLQKCLQSIRKLSYSPLEIFVVDNGSSDGSQDMVNKVFPEVILIKNKRNLGYSGGNNVGIKKSTGEYILILNNDTEVTKDFLNPLVSIMEKDSTIGCVQPKLIYGSNHLLLNAVGSYFTSTGFLYHYGYRKKSDLEKYNIPLTIYSAKGAAILLRKEVLEKVSLFDEDFFIFFEETDICHRIWLLGYKVIYEPRSTVYHYEAVDTSRQMKDYTRNYLSFRNRICSFIKNLELKNLIKILIAIFSIYIFLILFYFITYKWHLIKAIVDGIIWNINNFPKTMKKRRIIQSTIRKKSDDELFKTIKRDPFFIYYYYLFTTLRKFKGEKFLEKNVYRSPN